MMLTRPRRSRSYSTHKYMRSFGSVQSVMACAGAVTCPSEYHSSVRFEPGFGTLSARRTQRCSVPVSDQNKNMGCPLEPALPKLRGDPSSAYSEPLSTPYSWYTTEIDRSPQAASAGETLDLFRLKPAGAGRTAAKSLLRCLHERARAPLEHLYEAAHGPGWSLACALAWAVACL